MTSISAVAPSHLFHAGSAVPPCSGHKSGHKIRAEIRAADAELRPLISSAAPQMLSQLGVGLEVTGQLLTTVGDNPDRLRSQAAFAHLCGVAPIPASTGKTHRHRLNRRGTGRRATRSTPSCSPGCGWIRAPGPTSPAAVSRVCPSPDFDHRLILGDLARL
jgi:Transposase IS116/IS110/IS902 family